MGGNKQRTPLKHGKLWVSESSGNRYELTIESVIAFGGSCIVYSGFKAEQIGNQHNERAVIIKEFYPSDLPVKRGDDSVLNIPNQFLTQFEEKKRLFLKGQSKHSKYYEMAQTSALPRAFIYGEANNTVYAVSDPSVGTSLAEIDRSTLSPSNLASIMMSLCRCFFPIHENNLLYLDCKPENIFISDGRAYLFDFDTLISGAELFYNSYEFCASSEGWAAPEQLERNALGGYKNSDLIGFHTDIFSIGAVFFWLLTGRKPSSADLDDIQSPTPHWISESLCAGSSKETRELIDGIMRKLLRKDAAERMNDFYGSDSVKRFVYEKFVLLNTCTVGDDKEYAPLHDTVKQVEESILTKASSSEEAIKKEIRDNSLKRFLFGSKTRVVLFLIVIAGIAFGIGYLLQIGSQTAEKNSGKHETAMTTIADDHLLLELSNANHQYEVGLENWRRLDYNRAERDIKAARDTVSDSISQAEIEVAKINNSLGCLYLDMGRYEDAYDYLNNAYVTFRDSFGADSVEAIAALFSIAQYDYSIGDYESALKTAQKIIDLSDENNTVVLTAAKHFQATVYESLGNYATALQSCFDVLDYYQSSLENDKIVSNLSEYSKDSSLTEDERDAYTNAVQRIVTTYNSIGRLYISEGDYEKALSYLNTGLNISLNNVYIGTKNLSTAALYLNIARAEGRCGRLNEAMDSVDLAMRIELNLFDFESVYPGLVEVYELYGDLYLNNGDDKTAQTYFNDAVSLALTSYGENHPISAYAYSCLGLFYHSQGDNQKAEDALLKAIDIRKNILGHNHSETVGFYINLAEIQIDLGKANNAEATLAAAADICEKIGLDSSYTERITAMRSLIENS